MLTSTPACSRCQTRASSSRTRAPKTRMVQPPGTLQRPQQAAVHGRRVAPCSCAASDSTCAAASVPTWSLLQARNKEGRCPSYVLLCTAPCQNLVVLRPAQAGSVQRRGCTRHRAAVAPRVHHYPNEALPMPQASPGRQRVETWLQADGAPLSPRAYRARALAELSRSTTFLERRRAPHHAGRGPLHCGDGAAGPAGGACAERPRSVKVDGDCRPASVLAEAGAAQGHASPWEHASAIWTAIK